MFAETRAKEEELELPRLQKTLFPDFEAEFPAKDVEEVFHSDNESIVEICKRISNDFEKLAIALSKLKLT